MKINTVQQPLLKIQNEDPEGLKCHGGRQRGDCARDLGREKTLHRERGDC